MMTKNKRLLIIVLTIGLILLIPFIAMQFTKEVNWSVDDFLLAGALLSTLGFLIELVFRKVALKANRIGILILILLAFLLIWAELAVGLFGTPFTGS